MSEWTAKRFWKEVAVLSEEDGFAIHLDGRPVKSPGKRALLLPNAALAEAVAAEWEAVSEVIDPRQMPFTRSINSALDQLAPQRVEVIDMLAGYAETDLLCHRAEAPQALVKRQAEGWDGPLDWASKTLAAPLAVTSGVLPADQPAESLAALRQCLVQESDLVLTGLYDLISISGSIVLGLAVRRGVLSAAEAWTLSRIDEDWQIEQWGEDEEASKRAENHRAAFQHASTFIALAERQ